jgi:hypothetical protein
MAKKAVSLLLLRTPAFQELKTRVLHYTRHACSLRRPTAALTELERFEPHAFATARPAISTMHRSHVHDGMAREHLLSPNY